MCYSLRVLRTETNADHKAVTSDVIHALSRLELKLAGKQQSARKLITPGLLPVEQQASAESRWSARVEAATPAASTLSRHTTFMSPTMQVMHCFRKLGWIKQHTERDVNCMICCDRKGPVREGRYDLHPFTLLLRTFPAAGPFSAGNPEHFIPMIWELNFNFFLSLLYEKEEKKILQTF